MWAAATGQKHLGEPIAANVSTAETPVVPDERPDLIGKIKEIIGNEVTVYVVQVPPNGETPEGNRPNPTSRQANPDVQTSMPGNRGAGLNIKETETFIIPVGTPIATMQMRGDGTVVTELSGIKKDQFLRIWRKDDTVVFVQIMPTGGNREIPFNRDGTGGNVQRPDGSPGMVGMGPMGPGRQPRTRMRDLLSMPKTSSRSTRTDLKN